MATGSLNASTTQLSIGGQVTLSISVTAPQGRTITLSADNDPGDASDWKSVALDESNKASVAIRFASAGNYTFTLNIDSTAALDEQNCPITAGPIAVTAGTTTAAPIRTTTAVPAATTTVAPANKTTTQPPTTTTVAPAQTTTHAPARTTTASPHPATTAAPPATTSAAPDATTTNAVPSNSTTGAPSPAGGASPDATTTAAPTGDAPTFAADSVSVAIDPDDGTEQNPKSIQVATDVKLTLKWSATGAESVDIDPGALTGQPASGSLEIPTQDATYTLVAIASSGTRSEPYSLDIHTHAPGTVVSPHVNLGSGSAAVLSFIASRNSQAISSAAVGETITLTAVVSDATESVKINGDDAELSDLPNGQKQAIATVAIDAKSDGNFDCQAIKDGAVAQETAQQIDILPAPATTTTGAPGHTTTSAPSHTTTVAQAQTTTRAPGQTTTAAPDHTTSHAPGTTTSAAPSTSAPTVTLSGPDVIGSEGGDVALSWKVTGDYASLKLSQQLPSGSDGSSSSSTQDVTCEKDGTGTTTITLAAQGDATSVVFTLVAKAKGAGQSDGTATATIQVGPTALTPEDVKDLDLSFVDAAGGVENAADVDWNHLKFEKDIEKGPYDVLPEKWFPGLKSGKEFEYAKVKEINLTLSFKGKLFTFPEQEKSVSSSDVEKTFWAHFENKLVDLAATKPEGKFAPFSIKAKPKLATPKGKIPLWAPSADPDVVDVPKDGSLPALDLGISFSAEFGEQLSFEGELAIVKFQKKADGSLAGGVGEIELAGNKALSSVEMVLKNPKDETKKWAAVKGTIFIGLKCTIEPNWEKILEKVGLKLAEEEFPALALDLTGGVTASDLALGLLAQPELLVAALACAIPFIVVYEIISAQMDADDLKKLGETWDAVRSNYPQGVIDGVTAKVKGPSSKPYDLGYQHGTEARGRILGAYKKKFLANDTNSKWAMGRTLKELDAVCEKAVTAQLLATSLPYTIAIDFCERLKPGWRHDLYTSFRDAHQSSPWVVRDVAFTILYGDVTPHDDYSVGYNIKTVPSDVFFNSADPDAWYNHPPRAGATKVGEGDRGDVPAAPKAGDLVASGDAKYAPSSGGGDGTGDAGGGTSDGGGGTSDAGSGTGGGSDGGGGTGTADKDKKVIALSYKAMQACQSYCDGLKVVRKMSSKQFAGEAESLGFVKDGNLDKSKIQTVEIDFTKKPDAALIKIIGQEIDELLISGFVSNDRIFTKETGGAFVELQYDS